MGAWPVDDGVAFAVWSPDRRLVEVELYPAPGQVRHAPLARQDDGVHRGVVPGVGAGTRYRYRLDGGPSFPDPCSRYQPEGVHGPSEVVDPAAFTWTDAAWPGLDPDRLVLYELHVGTATPGGTFDALIEELPALTRLGVTALELMPVAECPGRWNWGYDGVYLYSAASYYGGPDGLRRLVDAAHRHGLGVIMDVVYNHLGPEGNYLGQYARAYFTDRYQTLWGEALNFDGPGCARVRAFMLENALHWLTEYHCDGLRLDAVHAIFDRSEKHLLQEIAERCHELPLLPGRRHRPLVTLESHDNDVRLIHPRERGGYGVDAVWADDFHHAVRVCLTGERGGYFADYPPTLETVAKTIEQGFFYQGEHAPFWGGHRGTRVTDEPGRAFIFCIQNHDQVGNRPFGERLHHEIDRDRYAAASALLLLCPETPLLFMGQEWAASAPFQFFTDHPPELGRLVTEGRRREYSHFVGFHTGEIPDPQDPATFHRSKLDPSERDRPGHAEIYRLYRELLALRATDPVFAVPDRSGTRAWPIGASTLALYRIRGVAERLVVVHLGRDPVTLTIDGERFASCAPATGWQTLWHWQPEPGAAPRLDPSGDRPMLHFDGAGALVLGRRSPGQPD